MANTQVEPRGPAWRRMARKPVVQFIVLGALLFGVQTAATHHAARRSDAIVVTALAIETLRDNLARGQGRAPTDAELRAEVDRSIDDEVLYREALLRGLGRGDDLVRRHIVQRMLASLHDPHSDVPPGDDALNAFIALHRDRYATPPRVSFVQVYFSRVQRHEAAGGEARAALDAISHGADPTTLGDRLSLGDTFDERTVPSLAADFGADFASAIASAPDGHWTGPFESRFGLHIVRVTSRVPAGVLTLEQGRGRVTADFLEARRTEATEAAVRALRARHTVRIDWPSRRP